MVVVIACTCVLLFYTCSVTSFTRVFIMFNSSGSRISDKSSYRCPPLMVSNAFVISSSRMLVEQSQDAIALSHNIFIAKTCSLVLLPFLLSLNLSRPALSNRCSSKS